MRNPFKRDPIEQRLKQVNAELKAFTDRRQLAAAEQKLSAIKQAELYATADPSVRARMDVEKEIEREHNVRGRKARATRRERIAARQSLIRLDPEAMRLLAGAKEESVETVTVHAQESILDAINGSPFGFDLIAEYRNLLQVPTLIRELWPYKPTILRTLPMLDFARWVCRVVYEECLTAKGLVKGKTNYICRGMRAKVVLKDLNQKKEEDNGSMGQTTDTNGIGDDANPGPAKVDGSESEAVGGGGQQDDGGGDKDKPGLSGGDNGSSAADSAPDPKMKEAQRLLDDFVDKRNYLELRRERRRRMMIEGEAFMWVEKSDEHDEPPYVCFVEPDYIRPSQKKFVNQEDPSMGGMPGQQDWSMGILTPHHQYWNPKKYQIVWNDLQEQVVDVKDMFHTAVRERSNIKRCLPPMFAMVDDLIRMTLLRAALADASKFRASIGGVVKYETASQQAISDWESTVTGGNLGDSADAMEMMPVESAEAANIVSLAAGRDWVKGPDWPDAGCLEMLYNWHIRAIAQAEQVPEWLVSGATADGSYASATTSESVSIIEFEAEQEIECKQDKRVLTRVMELYQEQNLVDKDFFEIYDIHVEGEDMTARDIKAETETAVLQVQNKFCSRATAQASLGFDPEREDAMIEGDEMQLEKEQAEADAIAEGGAKTLGGQQQKEQGGDPA